MSTSDDADRADEAQSREPYGPPIFEAMDRGELSELKAVAEAARRALYRPRFRDVSPESAADVREALQELDQKIRDLEHRRDEG